MPSAYDEKDKAKTSQKDIASLMATLATHKSQAESSGARKLTGRNAPRS